MNADALNELKSITEERRSLAIENARKNGVIIPCTDGVIIGENVCIGEGTVILPGCILLGNTQIGTDCAIGPNTLLFDMKVGSSTHLNSVQGYLSQIGSFCDFGPFTHIRPNTHIADRVHLGNFVEAKNSVIDEGTKVSHLTYVGDSDVGKNVNFGCGCVTVNYNGKTKNRCEIGDNAFIGCNTNLVAPVKVGDGAYTAAGSTITDDVPGEALAIARARQVNKKGWKLKTDK